MKKKYLAILLSLTITAAIVTGCGSSASSDSTTTETTEASTDSEEAGDVIYGEVTAVGEDSITINVGTQKEMSQPDGENASSDGTDSEDGDSASDEAASAEGEAPAEEEAPAEGEAPADGETPSMLDLTGEEMEITVTDDISIVRQSMGGGQGGPGGSGEAPEGEESDGEAPEMPEGEAGDGEAPEKPEGEESDGEAPEMPEGEAGDGEVPGNAEEEISLSDISEGDTISITYDEDGNVTKITVMSMGGQMGGPGGGQAAGVDSYDADTDITEDTTMDGDTVASTGTDENAILVENGATASLQNLTVSRDSEDSTGGDNSSFYGVGAAILTTDGTSYISNNTITTDANGGAGAFAYGDGTVYIADSTINTTQDTSGGIHAAGGGTLYAWNLDVTTNGESSAAIRSDRGGGTMVVDGGSYTSNGTGSPAVYSTADISINDATLTSTSSEAVCIEGLNTLRLFNTTLSGSMQDDEQNDCTWNVILYQSMSGDSEEGNSTFEMNGGTLTAENGGMFYTTNTESTFTLKDVEITYAEENDFFLKCTGNSNQRGWGSTGENGADCLFTAISQEMQGDVIWDSISVLDYYMTDGSTLTGAVVNDESNAGDGGDGYCNVYIDASSTWTVTGDSTLTSLASEGNIVDEDGNTVTIQGTDGTVYVEGSSAYTITVESYSDSCDTSGASQISEWSSYEVEEPSELQA